MSSRTVIPARFNGPPTTANGGYSCGVLGTLIGDSAEVTLRKPPPLERELIIEVDESGPHREWRLLDEELLIATGRAAEPDVRVPEPPSFARAQAAEAAYVGYLGHHFPTCFVCGPKRAQGDGLRLFTGRVDKQDLVASAWTPAASVGSEDGTVDPKVVWSALDCPTYFAGRMKGFGRYAVLGRQTAALRKPLRVGEPYLVVGWPIGMEGKKWEGGSALFSAEGELHAFARGLWVNIPEP
jgi:hypothetical protein